ncbi:ribonuclease Z [Paenibacillus sambharensis]|uniref:Ribonuclease Z n=1 Tax=Paenibacillus sambharensis TaxID=1803190 RepID=A0A2W1LGS2_9BACL|nr:ribonuclease Z [Paenibacillus sambharensis]PZD93654.1 ribonuclease Z [Paenibacillus sambharensis]
MDITFLGTGAGRPVSGRNVTSSALRLPAARGTFWLFDCGEGTQHQLMKTSHKLSRLERIFITHLHGDHTFGLPGLLSSRAFSGGTTPVTVYGPKGIKQLIEMSLSLTQTNLEYELHIEEIEEEGIIFEDEQFTVTAAELEHRVPCFGYRIVEKPVSGKLNAIKLQGLGVKPGPVYGRLKQGLDAELPDGRMVYANEVKGPSIPGRVITILGDTSPCENTVLLGVGADLLVHEATFAADLPDKAVEFGHSTTIHAAEAAVRAGAKKLVITHFSSRYRQEDLEQLADEARVLFPETLAATDLLTVPIPRIVEPRE